MKNVLATLLTAAVFFVFAPVAIAESEAGTTKTAENTKPARAVVLENKHVRFEFEPETMGLAGMVDRATGFNHIRPVEGKHLLWELALGKGPQVYTITNNYKPCTHHRIEMFADGSRRAVLQWKDIRWWLEDKVLSVTVTIDLPVGDGVAQWRIAVDNRSDYWGLWAVLFPIVNGFPSAGEYDIARPVFASGGQLLPKWSEPIWGRYPGGGWPMQFMSFNRGTNAVYLATKDVEARAKDFKVEPIKGLKSERYPVVYEGRRHRTYVPEPGERIYIKHFPDNMGVAGSDYPDYYPVEFGVYQGGWVEAAHRYRPWTLKQKWARMGPLSQREDIPDSIKGVGVWIRDGWEWQGKEGTPHEMNLPLLEARKRLGVPVGLQWYHWHHMPFDNEYPHFLPAKDGFKERVEELVNADMIVMPYINGSSADMNIADWDRFAPHAVRDEAGGLRHHFYSERAGRLLSMCTHQELWQDEISSLVGNLTARYGVNGVYVDQVSGLYHELCFDERHGHPLGGGNYWAEGCRELLRKARSAARKHDEQSIMTSEGASEIFFDLLDGNLTWGQPSDREIPLLQLVYSGYTIFFGSPCDYKRGDNYFNYSQGQALIDGRQNGWMDLRLFEPEHAKKVEYLRQCGRYRLAGEEFLTYGRLIKPLAPTNKVPTFSEAGMGWGMYEKQRTASLPSAEARLWQSEHGNLAVVIANYVDREITFSYAVNPSEYGLTSGKFQVSEITPSGIGNIELRENTVTRTETLSPLQLRIIVISPVY